MQEGTTSQESISLTEEQIKKLTWYATDMWKLVDIRGFTELGYNSGEHNTPFSASNSDGYLWLIGILKDVNSQPNHPLCNKLQLVQNPYVR